MNERPFFSIVMPTYGVEAYIEHAVRSIMDQTESDWEILIVNDCTPDLSIQIAESIAKEDTRIRIVSHEVNQGLSAARNTGIREARGEYVWFMDPDDYVEPDVLEKVRESLKKNPAEAVMFGLIEEYYDADGNLEYTHSICPEEQLYTEQADFRKKMIQYEQETLYGYAWNKLYNLNYLREKQLTYQNVKLIEDIEFNIRFFMDIERLNVLGITPYHYAKRLSANLTNQFVPEYFAVHRKRIELLFRQYQYWELCTLEVRQILGGLYARYILSALERNCDRQAKMRPTERFRWCRAVFSQSLFQTLIPVAEARDSMALRITLKLLKGRHVIGCLALGRGVHIVRKTFPTVYSKVKSER